MSGRFSRLTLAVGAAFLVPACGDGGGSSLLQILNPAGTLSLNVSGGSGTRSGSTGVGVGGMAGTIEVNSQGSIRMGTQAAPLPPTVPPPPTTGTVVTNFPSPTGYTQATGNLIISGNLATPSGVPGPFTITASEGDIVISATLQSGEGGGNTRPLIISAGLGTVFITGAVRTANVDAVLDGDWAGNLTISARQIVVTGVIDTRGEANDSGAGGSGGAISLDTTGTGGTDLFVVGGTLLASGAAGTATGGAGGAITLSAGNEAHLHGSATSRGGSVNGSTAPVTAGNAGDVTLTGPAGVAVNAVLNHQGGDASLSANGTATGGNGGRVFVNRGITGPLAFFGSADLRGGIASGPGGASAFVTGGIGGAFMVGFRPTPTPGAPASIDLGLASWTALGGSGSDVSGNGVNVRLENRYDLPGDISFDGILNASTGTGTGAVSSSISLYVDQGDIRLGGTLLSRAGDGAGNADPGGVINVTCGDGEVSDRGSIFASAAIDVRGGNSTGPSSSGGPGGDLVFSVAHAFGEIVLEPGFSVTADGGDTSGTGTAGGGGLLRLETGGSAISIHGTSTSRGGRALGAGGTGGAGGVFQAFSDNDMNGVGGDITLHAGAVVDVSGGSGTVGGDALFGLGVAVVLDADQNNSNSLSANGVIANFGQIIARGGAVNGAGGDALFNGLNTAGAVGPNPFEPGGLLDLRRDGPGPNGAFTSQ